MNPNQLIIEKTSLYDFNTTVEMLVIEAERREWKVPMVHDLQHTLAKVGKTVAPVSVIEVCKPTYSGQILELNNERMISVMMPCRISVYEKEDGKTYISLVNSGDLAEGMPGTVKTVMTAATNEIVEIVKSVIQ
jgi:uncharacterized protein (DUF302 family)